MVARGWEESGCGYAMHLAGPLWTKRSPLAVPLLGPWCNPLGICKMPPLGTLGKGYAALSALFLKQLIICEPIIILKLAV